MPDSQHAERHSGEFADSRKPPSHTAAALQAREQRSPRLMTGFRWVEEFLRGGCPAREVPEEHWEPEEHPEGFAVAFLQCVCGVAHCLTLGEYPQRCHCPRRFFYDGTRVWALNSPRETGTA